MFPVSYHSKLTCFQKALQNIAKHETNIIKHIKNKVIESICTLQTLSVSCIKKTIGTFAVFSMKIDSIWSYFTYFHLEPQAFCNISCSLSQPRLSSLMADLSTDLYQGFPWSGSPTMLIKS
eukprot:g1759.t1